MEIDSTAELLFRISADASDAQANIQRFRSLMGKDLAAMKAEFADWSRSTFGDLSSASGKATAATAAALAGIAALAAGAAAAAKQLWEAGQAAAAYAGEIDDAGDQTGLSAEQLSGLRYAAQATGVGFGELVNALVKFESAIIDAQIPTSKQAQAFARLGISQREIRDGAKDMLPLLYRVSDAFAEQASTVVRTATARELFGRAGAHLNELLAMGSRNIRELTGEAERLGLVIGEKDLEAAKAFTLQITELKSALEAVRLSIGVSVLPLLTEFALRIEAWIAMARRWREGAQGAQWWESFIPGAREISTVRRMLPIFGEELERARADLERKVTAAMEQTGTRAPALGAGARQAGEDFRGLSDMLEQVRFRLAGLGSEEERVVAETARLESEAARAATELAKLREAGKIAPETYRREMAALRELPAAIRELGGAQIGEIARRHTEAVSTATEDLRRRIEATEEDTVARRRALWDADIEALRQGLRRRYALTEENERLLDQLREAGQRKINREQLEAFREQLVSLQEHLAEMVTARFTAQEQIEWMYQRDVERFSQAQEQMTLATVEGEGQREAIHKQYELLREAALRRYQDALNELRNSTGWRGVFGEEFGALIRGNEELLREWVTSVNQAMLMVRVAIAGTHQLLMQTMRDFSRAMAANIAQALVYRVSIGEAMREAAASTLAALAAESYTYAIYSTALGFLRLAQWDFAGAAQAFTAAGLFAGVGTAAAVAGRAIAPRREQAAAGGAEEFAAGGAASGVGTAPGEGGGGPRVTVIVQGHIIGRAGVEELTDMINEAVRSRDVPLYATAVKHEARITR